MKLITRNQYLEKLINVVGTPDIKVITGVRRSGKSKLLEAFKNHIEQNIPDHNIIGINFNLPEFDHLLEYRPLYDYINSQYVAGKENFVLIDEVQMCTDFEKAINGLHASEKFDIYITGSNAFLLSSDLATLFTGRTFEIKVLQNGLVGSPCSPRDSQESSPTPQFKSINSLALSLLHSPTLTSIQIRRWKRYLLIFMKGQWLF